MSPTLTVPVWVLRSRIILLLVVVLVAQVHSVTLAEDLDGLKLHERAAACVASPTPIQSPSSSYHCRSQGSDSGPAFISRFLSDTKSYVSCENACWATKNCISFAYNQGNNYCRLFDMPVTGTGFVKGSTGIYYWNLKGCFQQPAPCSPVSTTTVGIDVIFACPMSGY